MDSFSEFALIVGVAAVLSGLLVKLKQPAILGYILTGLLIGAFVPGVHDNQEQYHLLSTFGVAFLLFILGLELNLKELRELGRVALATGIGQVVFTFTIGFVLTLALGFSQTAALYVAIGLTFSSTIVIIKLLTQKQQLDTLYGRISVGFLLVQDFIAIIILVLLTASQRATSSDLSLYILDLAIVLMRGAIGIAIVLMVARFVLTPFLNSLRHETELLFVTVVAWALCVAMFISSELIGLSVEIGALVAGIALANRGESLQFESWTKPLRDFFIVIFFVLIGLEVNLTAINNVLLPAIVLSVFVLVGNPLIVMLIMRPMGYSARTSFFTSLAVAQISEFSLIIVKLAYDINLVSADILTMMTIVGGITMTVSSLAIYYNDKLHDILRPVLRLFEPANLTAHEVSAQAGSYDFAPEVVLFGYHRMGTRILRNLHPAPRALVVDIDPRVVRSLKEQHKQVIFGDIQDMAMYPHYKLDAARIVISTVPDVRTNRVLINYIEGLPQKPLLVLVAHSDEALKHYQEMGVQVVVYPHQLAGEKVRELLAGQFGLLS